MKRYFIIGKIGSGKSSLRHMFEQEGCYCFDLDKLGHEVLCQDEVKLLLSQKFGNDILVQQSSGSGSNTQIDRKALAAKVFCSAEKTAELNEITHPYIIKLLDERSKNLNSKGLISVVECSAFKSGFLPYLKDADTVVSVRASFETRMKRSIDKGFSVQDFLNRDARQMSQSDLDMIADVVFDNGASADDLRSAFNTWWGAEIDR